MDTLPAEILDLIMLQVEKLKLPNHDPALLRLYPNNPTTFEPWRSELWRSVRLLSYDKGYRALAALRLVNRAICFSASRLFFRNIVWRLERKKMLAPKEIFNGLWTTNVRKLQIFLCEDLRYSQPEVFQDRVKQLKSILQRLTNLQALEFQSEAHGCFREIFSTMIAEVLYSLPLRSLAELEVVNPVDYCHCHKIGERTNFVHLLRKIRLDSLKHLGLNGIGSEQNDVKLELLQFVSSAVNIESLSLFNYGHRGFSTLCQYINVRQLRYLQLGKGSIPANELLNMLEQCKKSIRYLEITGSLDRDSWLRVLFQISVLSLLKLEFSPRYQPERHTRERRARFDEKELEHGLLQNIGVEQILCFYVHDVIQREVDANRVAAGLIPLHRDVELPPMESVMRRCISELSSFPDLISVLSLRRFDILGNN